MIVNFYKFNGMHGSIRDAVLLCSKNIDCIPIVETFTKYSGQYFKIIKVILDTDSVECNVYMKRV